MTYQLEPSGECIDNRSANVEAIADDLMERGHVVTTWTDWEGSKFDLLWSFDATRIGRSSMVDAGPAKLFVGVVGLGCFGFQIGHGYLAPDYVGEKLKVTGTGTRAKLAELIGSVRERLRTDIQAAAPGVQ